MNIIGWILLVIGGILFFGAKFVFLKNEKKSKQKLSKDDKEFMSMVNNGMIVFRVIGGIMVIVGGAIIMFIK